MAALESAKLHDGSDPDFRMLRCALVASDRSVQDVERFISGLAIDYRDVIVAGEYTTKNGEMVQVRDLSHPFRMGDTQTNNCPVCSFSGLDEPPYDEHGCSSFEICPSFGTEFGYDDSKTPHEELRKRWISGGKKWWSSTTRPPANWDADVQLKNRGSE